LQFGDDGIAGAGIEGMYVFVREALRVAERLADDSDVATPAAEPMTSRAGYGAREKPAKSHLIQSLPRASRTKNSAARPTPQIRRCRRPSRSALT
jgi:hypothetical protein